MKKLFSFTMLLTILFTVSTMLACRLKMPDTENLSDSCKVFLLCLYQNQENPDKTVCSKLADACGNIEIFKACGGAEALEKSELQFLKCVSNLK